jgi:8-oxo-dGTP pyrophosphatase MutT (NUDIX family)
MCIGLIEAGETPEVAALRELHEETGYHGKVISVGPLIPYEPGLTNSGTRMVQVEASQQTGCGILAYVCMHSLGRFGCTGKSQASAKIRWGI